jgi:hypothetical protein
VRNLCLFLDTYFYFLEVHASLAARPGRFMHSDTVSVLGAGFVRNQSALAYVMIHISTWNQPGTTMSVIAAGATASSCKRNCC